MVENIKSKNEKSDLKLVVWIIIGFIFIVWLCTPPGNKFMQICFWGNNTQFFIAKLQNKDEITAYKFHRNNAIYLVRMKQPRQALKEMDKSIQSYPSYMDDNVLQSLYKDRGDIKLFYKDYSGALADYLKVSNLSFTDKFKLAMLYKENGNNKLAVEQCNSILSIDANAYSGYLCLAEVYAGVGRPDASARVFDLLINRVPGRAKYYADRSKFKKMAGDINGAEVDLAKAKELNPRVNLESSLVKEILEPKILNLSIK